MKKQKKYFYGHQCSVVQEKTKVIERYLRLLRFSKYHKGMGDITLGLGQQEDLIKFLKK